MKTKEQAMFECHIIKDKFPNDTWHVIKFRGDYEIVKESYFVNNVSQKKVSLYNSLERIWYEPEYEHDCARCRTLGNTQYRDINFDLYIDLISEELCARFGNKPEENISMPIDVTTYMLSALTKGTLNHLPENYPIFTAYHKAVERKYIPSP